MRHNWLSGQRFRRINLSQRSKLLDYTLDTVNFVICEYQLALGGVPDLGGAAYWTHALADGTQTDETMSFTFASSTEFINTYHISATTVMNSDTAAFTYVEALYKNAFNETLGQLIRV